MTASVAYQNPSALVQELLAAGMMRLSIDGLSLINPDGTVFANRVAAPTFAPVAGAYGAAQAVVIASATPGTTIYYTVDGSEPTRASSVYGGAVNVPLGPDVTIKAIAILAGLLDSAVASALYSFTKVATPAFNPVAGAYVGAQNVTISCTTPGASIYYTVDGSAPTNASTPYTVPVAVAASKTVKAIAYKSGLTTSAVGSAAYAIS